MKWQVACKEIVVTRVASARAQKAVAEAGLGVALFGLGLWRFRRQIQ